MRNPSEMYSVLTRQNISHSKTYQRERERERERHIERDMESVINIVGTFNNDICVKTDFKEIRNAFISPSIPPPSTFPFSEVPDITFPMEACGEVYGKRFSTHRGVVGHRANAVQDGGQHGALTVEALVPGYKCIYSRAALGSRASAQQYVRKATTSGHCYPDLATTPAKSLPAAFPFKCKICDVLRRGFRVQSSSSRCWS